MENSEHTTSKRAVIYCRVSTKEQVDDGNSLVTQERLCREYADKNNYEIAQVFIEMGESAKSANRTELKNLQAFCTSRKNHIDAVIVYKIDRLSRNIDDYSQIRLNFKRYGIEIKSTTEYFEDNPAGRFMENIIANVAQFDNEVRAERSWNGMKEAVREGRYVWMSPLGYSNGKINDKSNIVPNEYSPIIIDIFQRVSEEKESLEDIRKSVFQNITHSRRHVGKIGISKGHFYRLIRNRTYSGWIEKFGQSFKGSYEPLISEALFDKVQGIINKEKSKRKYVRYHPDFPLRQFCYNKYGTRLTGAFSKGHTGKRYPYYFFKKDFQYYRKDAIEKDFIDHFNGYKFKEEKLMRFRHWLRVELRVAMNEINKAKIELQEQIQKIIRAKATLVRNLTTTQVTEHVFKTELANLTEEEKTLQFKLGTLPEHKINVDELYSQIKFFLIEPGTFWQKSNLNMKLKLQCFNFPNGILYEEIGIRTEQKPLFHNSIFPNRSPLSRMVHHLISKTNHPDIANCSEPEKSLTLFDYITTEELEQLKEYLNNLSELGNIVKPTRKYSLKFVI